nr:transporter [Pseudomonas sp. PGPR40]
MMEAVKATEGGGSAYPIGINGVMAGKSPPLGLSSYSYVSDYHATQTKDGDGHNKKNIDDFDIHVRAISLRLDYGYDQTLFGAKMSSRVALPYVKGDLSFTGSTPTGSVRHSGSKQGLADLTVVPLMLGWGTPNYKQLIGVDIFAPTGEYDKKDLFNPGRNVWTYGPWYAFTAFPIPDLEISSKLSYLISGTNDATHYRSGKEFNADYNIAYNVTPHWQFGMSGYLYKQLSDDQRNGLTYNDGNRGQVVAFGPLIKYQTPEIGVVLKWQHETAVENRASGDRIWLQLAYKFW